MVAQAIAHLEENVLRVLLVHAANFEHRKANLHEKDEASTETAQGIGWYQIY
jgi:hypothetical protein